jgi:TPR repeat protein
VRKPYWTAVSEGLGVADNQLRYLYQHSLGVAMNLKTAYCWYTFAMVQGSAQSSIHIGELADQDVTLTPGANECEVINHRGWELWVGSGGQQWKTEPHAIAKLGSSALRRLDMIWWS